MGSYTDPLGLEPHPSLVITEIDPTQAPMDLLLEADPYPEKIRKYLFNSRCYEGRLGQLLVGVYVLVDKSDGVWELMNIAVTASCRDQGFGAQLLRHAIATAQGFGAKRLEVGTGTFGYQLRYYQKAGFRVFAVERDFFLNNYSELLFEDGIQHQDMLRLAIDFR